MEITCSFCNEPLKELGGLLFGPPDKFNVCEKAHICVDCYGLLDVVHKENKDD